MPVPALIDLADFDAAQKRMAQNREQARRNVKREYLLGRRLKCAKCGYSYGGRTRREKHQYYVCNGSQQVPVKLCDMPAFRVDAVDNTVWEWVKGLMQHPEQIAAGLQADQAEAERAHSALRERLALIDTRLADS